MYLNIDTIPVAGVAAAVQTATNNERWPKPTEMFTSKPVKPNKNSFC
jgi:hypothetical protein